MNILFKELFFFRPVIERSERSEYTFPSKNFILKCFLRLHRKNNETLQDTARVIAQKVITIWSKKGIPCVEEHNIINLQMPKSRTAIVHCATRENKCFSRVAHGFFSTSGSESGFVCPARGNKVHFMAR